ncbi:MAG: ATP-grasp domain-containing protein [Myxococcales bacterium]|nr:ATP-grasp domain-containing protein [Myxococcales bacterium]
MDVLFLSPNYPPEMQQFSRGLREAGARVHGVGDTPVHQLSPELRRSLASYLHAPAMGDTEDVRRRISSWLGGRRPDRLETLWEPMTMLAAELRQEFGLPGMSPDAVHGFRDKPLMRARVERTGLRIPKTIRVRSVAEALAALAIVGFPAILKPVDGAGCADTHRVDDLAEFEAAVATMRHVAEATVEEFVDGEELTYETLCVDGRILYQSVCRYEPVVLVARRNEWISPIIQALRSHDGPNEAAGVRLGRAAVRALGMGTGITHMEWFRKADGTAIFGEIACRPPGANMVDLMNFADDGDLYLDWARAVVHGTLPERRPRGYSSAIVFKRAQGTGRVTQIDGLEAFVTRHRKWIARVDLLPVGAERRDWTQTFLADGNLVVRHPDDATCLELAREAAASIQMFAA